MAQQYQPNRGGYGQNPARGQSNSGGGFQQGTRQEDDYDLKAHEASIKKWIESGIDRATVDFAHDFGKYVANNQLTTSQIRSAFGEMRRIQMNKYVSEKTAFLLLKPKLAYAVKRHDKKGLTKFYQLFSLAYDAVDTEDDTKGTANFGNMMNLMEAVLAYHKFHGGKE